MEEDDSKTGLSRGYNIKSDFHHNFNPFKEENSFGAKLAGLMDIEELIKKYDKEFGTLIFKNLQSGTYENKERQALVRVVIDEVVKISGDCYPPKEVLISVAKSIVTVFPALRSKFREGYEHFCDPETGQGYLSFRLKNMRKYLGPGKRRRNKGRKRVFKTCIVNN